MDLISRAEWGARHTDVDKGKQPTTPIDHRREFFVHWLAERPAKLRGAELVRWVQEFHIDTRGWADIGYNFAVDVDGRAYVGRGRDVIGAHCLNHNTSGIGVVVLIGQGEHPTPEALASVRELWLECSHAAGQLLTPLGHRDGYATSCPGDELYRWVHHDLAATTVQVSPSVLRAAARPLYPGHPLQIGSHGDAVRIWQAKMHARGWLIDVDGIYGKGSAASCRAFQAEKNLHIDGIVGPRTWAATWSAQIT